jgi:protein-disulfide isomerase
MITRNWLKGAVAAFACLLTATAALAGDKTPVAAHAVAVVAGDPVTEDELNAAIGNKLMRVKTEEYNARRAALDEIIANRLLHNEATRRHQTVDELLHAEVDSKVSVPASADLETFYDGVKDRFPGVSKDDALKSIAEGMRRQQSARKKAEFVQKLRVASGVKVLLDPPRAEVKAEGPSRGMANAPVTIVEFSDFECPFCSRAVDTIRKVRETYGDKVRIVFRDFPLASHRAAPRAAEAARCADEQEKFWEMHDHLFAKGGVVGPDVELRKAATEAGLNIDAFNTCLASGKYAGAWKASQEDGFRAGVASTPTFFVNGRMIVGAAAYETFAAAIDEELERVAAPSSTTTLAAAH